jgi:3-hydroxybutyryl-CoA dehydrogenase
MACIAGLGMMVGDQRMGPLEYADGVGLDVVVQKLEDLEKKLGPRFHPVALLHQKVKAGELGEKTGRGFMEYTT